MIAGFRPEHLELGDLAGSHGDDPGHGRRGRVPRQRGAAARHRRRPRDRRDRRLVPPGPPGRRRPAPGCRPTSSTCSTTRLRRSRSPGCARRPPPDVTVHSRHPAAGASSDGPAASCPGGPCPMTATRSRSASSSREVVHRGRYMEFRVDTIERADGSTRHPRRRRPSGRGRRARARRRRPAADRPPVARACRAGAARDPRRHARRPRRRHRGPRRARRGASSRRRPATAPSSWRKLADVLDGARVRDGADAPVPRRRA